MRIFAQRLDTEAMPIRSYIYIHGASWHGPPPPEIALPPARLAAMSSDETPAGVAVLSYFTVLAPDDVTPSEIGAAYARLYRADRWTEAQGRCLAQFSCAQPLASAWRSELQLLFLAAAAEHTAYTRAAQHGG